MKPFIYSFLFLSLISCQKEAKTEVLTANQSTAKDTISAIPKIPEKRTEKSLKDKNDEILEALKTQDFDKFATFIHPQKGVTFSMYAYIQPKKDKHFTKEEFLKYAPSNIKFTWGEKDGSGDLLQLSIQNYFAKWVFKKDFTNSEYAFNSFARSGNSLNNLKEIYPNTQFTENYIPGTAEFAEMDWNVLRFVFEEIAGKTYLVAVINDEWTT